MSRVSKRLVPTIFGMFAAFTANTYAGIYYEATSISTSDATSGETKTSVAVWSEGKSTRIEFKEGAQLGLFGPGSYLISSDAGENLYLVNPQDKTYAPFDLGGMMGAADKAMASMGGMIKMEVTDTHFDKVSEEAGDTLLGYPTQHVRFKSGYTLNMSVMGQKMDQVINMNQELWMTPAVDAAAFNAWLRPDKMMKGMFKGMSEMMDAQFAELKGAPLKSVVETATTGGMGGDHKSVMKTAVTSLRQETIPAATFVIPSDYTQTDLMAQPAAAQPGAASQPGQTKQTDNAAMEQGISTLKGLFKQQ